MLDRGTVRHHVSPAGRAMIASSLAVRHPHLWLTMRIAGWTVLLLGALGGLAIAGATLWALEHGPLTP